MDKPFLKPMKSAHPVRSAGFSFSKYPTFISSLPQRKELIRHLASGASFVCAHMFGQTKAWFTTDQHPLLGEVSYLMHQSLENGPFSQTGVETFIAPGCPGTLQDPLLTKYSSWKGFQCSNQLQNEVGANRLQVWSRPSAGRMRLK